MNFEQSYLDDFMNNDYINIDLDKFSIPLTGSEDLLSQSDFNNELYQIISNNSSISTPSSSGSFSSATSSNYNSLTRTSTTTPAPTHTLGFSEAENNIYSTKLEESLIDLNSMIKDSGSTLNYLDYSTYSSPLETNSIAASPANLLEFKFQTQQLSASRPQTPANIAMKVNNTPQTPALTHQDASIQSRNSSISSQSSSSQTHSSSSSKKNLDSRLSLQKLGELLNTSSIEETMKIEKFILDIFGKELGFPLGYKTWIRDTNEEYRKYLINELHTRASKVYPKLTKSLLETVIKRATYSMMQGRLRKERRAALKAKRSVKN
ncbi:hypothetical protein WICANDRAFT_62780 [Wickerhamomyces anomalus NRRL Y-366-8]|uniref:Uncharacterized protein n=1 Tax=Wickerhamomyces anomalus (strain ATCC 58044 / CBS 1984 / NCYC 433 / NRRL Y-366-8) TaxID=683960 RepID=A0A1E3P470_WICAA|nr:uncharacterized protein WICANDRAFT_62780 [Wickerhamomyces anomalus NRRL Y-366-8]ODQ60215.1 hypothetical protein WICANDRAFT_62780 [Wickerhamomyces anomalus NRRL Y-366-8]